jgi:hypothetical protein
MFSLEQAKGVRLKDPHHNGVGVRYAVTDRDLQQRVWR